MSNKETIELNEIVRSDPSVALPWCPHEMQRGCDISESHAAGGGVLFGCQSSDLIYRRHLQRAVSLEAVLAFKAFRRYTCTGSRLAYSCGNISMVPSIFFISRSRAVSDS